MQCHSGIVSWVMRLGRAIPMIPKYILEVSRIAGTFLLTTYSYLNLKKRMRILHRTALNYHWANEKCYSRKFSDPAESVRILDLSLCFFYRYRMLVGVISYFVDSKGGYWTVGSKQIKLQTDPAASVKFYFIMMLNTSVIQQSYNPAASTRIIEPNTLLLLLFHHRRIKIIREVL